MAINSTDLETKTDLVTMTKADYSRALAEAKAATRADLFKRMQIHFIFNSLAGIRFLCAEDGPRAEEALGQFSEFFRGNLRSLTEEQPISFREELKHFKSYLALTRLRFSDRVQVDLRLEAEDFYLPAMTLQPLVANAINHGLLKRPEGGTIKIATAELTDTYVLKLIDDGIGFAPEIDCNATPPQGNIGIIKSRLRLMCGGRLTIKSQPGEGVVVTIKIPKEAKDGSINS